MGYWAWGSRASYYTQFRSICHVIFRVERVESLSNSGRRGIMNLPGMPFRGFDGDDRLRRGRQARRLQAGAALPPRDQGARSESANRTDFAALPLAV